jgi:hypothetical protein
MDAFTTVAFEFCLNYLLEHPEHEALFVSLCFAQNHHAPAAIFTPIANSLRENPEERDNFLARYYGAKTAVAGGNVPMDVASVSGSEEDEVEEEEEEEEEEEDVPMDEEQEDANYIEEGIRANRVFKDFTRAQLHYINEHPDGHVILCSRLGVVGKLRQSVFAKLWAMKNPARVKFHSAKQAVKKAVERRAQQQNA